MNHASITFQTEDFDQWLSLDQVKLIDQDFLAYVKFGHLDLYQKLHQYRLGQADFTETALSIFLIELAQALESYVIDVFQIERSIDKLDTELQQAMRVARFKQSLVPSPKGLTESIQDLQSWSDDLRASLQACCPYKSGCDSQEEQWLRWGEWVGSQGPDHPLAPKLSYWYHTHQRLGSENPHRDWAMFQQAKRLDYTRLIETEFVSDDVRQMPRDHWRQRQGFELTDNGMSQEDISYQLNYCVECHTKQTDYCRSGFFKKKKDRSQGFKSNPLGEDLEGCPLDQRISEMNWLKRRRLPIAALAMIMRDNPLCPLTGHRICNDCMKSCIYQKQEPVDIPQIETAVLKDVLSLEWGAEIYDLLVRWNPLRSEQYASKPYQYKKVLIMGMGPAGLTMAHHLLMEGCAVVGMDGLKVEPLDHLKQPIRYFDQLKVSLDQRQSTGLGGVVEYGITVRWDKNFLSLVQMSLLRRKHFDVYGGIRFGGTITIEQAWALGFDHVVMAVGAGLPRELPIPGSLAVGMMQANDFLMNIHLNGQLKSGLLHAMQVRLPALIIGSGLTAVDTATEVQAYYLEQIKWVKICVDRLLESQSQVEILSQFSEPEKSILLEMLSHAKQLDEVGPDQACELIRSWGGVAIVYRKGMEDSPAYRHNHLELEHGLNEGILYHEWCSPTVVQVDSHGHVKALTVQKPGLDQPIDLPARSLFVATGLQYNIAYAYEHRGVFELKDQHYKAYDLQQDRLVEVQLPKTFKQAVVSGLTSYQDYDGKRVSFIGDMHPKFHGKVVKAMASAKHIYPQVIQALFSQKMDYSTTYERFCQSIRQVCDVHILSVCHLDERWVELTIQAPLYAQTYQLGQFYRMQTFESLARKSRGFLMHSQPVALYPWKVDAKRGQLTFMIQKKGVHEHILSQLDKYDRLSLMGPTGMRVKLGDTSRRIMILVEPLWFILADNLVQAYLDRGQLVQLVVDFSEIPHWLMEQWSGLVQHGLELLDVNPSHFDWASLALDQPLSMVLLLSVKHNCALKSQVAQLIQKSDDVQVQAAVDMPMQCMLKGICAQCLTYQIDESTGLRTKAVYACSWQIQPHQWLDWPSLLDRGHQHVLHQRLAKLVLLDQ